MPLYNFIKIIVTGDLKYLVKSGWVFRKQDLWDKIFDEYAELLPNKEQNRLNDLNKELNYLKNLYYMIQAAVEVLSRTNSEELKNILIKRGYRSINDLSRITLQSKSLKIQIIEKEAEYQKLEAELQKSSKEKPLIESDFDKTLVTLGKHLGHEVDSKKVMVSKYCAMIKSLHEDIKNGAR